MDLLNNKNRLKKEGYDEQKSGLPYKRGRKCFFAADSCISADSLSSFPFRDGFGTLPVKAGCRCVIGPFPSATLYEYVHILYSSNGKKSICCLDGRFHFCINCFYLHFYKIMKMKLLFSRIKLFSRLPSDDFTPI